MIAAFDSSRDSQALFAPLSCTQPIYETDFGVYVLNVLISHRVTHECRYLQPFISRHHLPRRRGATRPIKSRAAALQLIHTPNILFTMHPAVGCSHHVCAVSIRFHCTCICCCSSRKRGVRFLWFYDQQVAALNPRFRSQMPQFDRVCFQHLFLLFRLGIVMGLQLACVSILISFKITQLYL